MSEAMRQVSVEAHEKKIYPWYAIGLDLGSVSLNTVVLSPEGSVLEERYVRTKGQPMETTLSVLELSLIHI